MVKLHSCWYSHMCLSSNQHELLLVNYMYIAWLKLWNIRPVKCAKCTKSLMQQKRLHLQTKTSQIANLNSDFNMRNAISPICVHLCVWGDSKFPLRLPQLACSGVHFSCTLTHCTLTPAGLLWCTIQCNALWVALVYIAGGAVVYIGGAVVYTTLVHCTLGEGACA